MPFTKTTHPAAPCFTKYSHQVTDACSRNLHNLSIRATDIHKNETPAGAAIDNLRAG
jgi:hypothetical protein